jgi:hypothetical protein
MLPQPMIHCPVAIFAMGADYTSYDSTGDFQNYLKQHLKDQ